ncbi:MAG: diacylglycerol kinase family lipid kinase [Methanobacteriota archaeon]|nr:MAG: diacylglycerol kinase family lipid kinase [Euryarchaeota archaeon]
MAAETVFIVNPASSNGKTGRRWRAHGADLRRELGGAFDVHRTERRGHATDLARDALAAGARTVVAVGGDGTLNEVVNGFLADDGRRRSQDARLAFLPVGTGSDFARTLPMPRSAQALARLLREGRIRNVDAGRCEFLEEGVRRSRYFINIAEFGSGGAVVDRVNRTTKILGGRMSFTIAILRTLPKYRNTRVGYEADGGGPHEAIVNDFVVANGRYFGAGLLPAPTADLEDGLLDVVVFGDIDFKTARRNLPALRRGEHLTMKEVTTFRCRSIVVRSHEEMIDLDGESVGRHPLRFEVLPKAVPILSE